MPQIPQTILVGYTFDGKSKTTGIQLMLWGLCNMYHIAQNFGRGNFGEFGEFSVIRQSFPPPKMPLESFIKV